MLFLALEAKVMVSTTPDLGMFHLKRSLHDVHYVYVHHSMVSMHMIYRPGAFDSFDTIFCAGPHHAAEARAIEAFRGSPRKSLVAHGYGRLDRMCEAIATAGYNGSGDSSPHSGKHILVAPSWGPNGLIENAGRQLVQVLLDSGFNVTVRPHPETVRRTPEIIDDLKSFERKFSGFVLETDVAAFDSLVAADVMISDWSGVALEYAFAFEKPVLFVDVPRKVLNSDYAALGLWPVEVSLRDRIGVTISPTMLNTVPSIVADLVSRQKEWRESISAVRDEIVFNFGASARAGAMAILDLVNGHPVTQVDRGACILRDQALSLTKLAATRNRILDRFGDRPFNFLDSTEIDTLSFLLLVARRVSLVPGSAEYRGVERLARKIDIVRTVFHTYDRTWNSPMDRNPLTVDGYALLAVVFLTQAIDLAKNFRELSGDALSFVNSALNALDVAGDTMEADMRIQLYGAARALVEELSNSPTAAEITGLAT
jgi:hypothetical protein